MHPLQCLLHAPPRERPSVSKRMEQDGGEIAVDHRDAVFGSSAVTGRVAVEEVLADLVATVVLVHTNPADDGVPDDRVDPDRKSTRLNSSHANISYAVFCLK